MPTIFQRLQHGWNAFRGRDRPEVVETGSGSYRKPDKSFYRRGNERSIITAIYNRIATDVAAHTIEHVIVDEDGFYLQTVHDALNYFLTVEANIDQTSRAFVQDAVFSLFEEGYVALVPTNAPSNPMLSTTFEANVMRTAKILTWYPKSVMVEVYDDNDGTMKQRLYAKSSVAIIENPFYAIMNEPNSILQRLIRKLNILDVIDEQNGSGKLDLIIQLPYTVRSDLKKKQAEERRKDIEMQLVGSKYGIAYMDATEKITQLNRPIENHLMSQIEYLMNTLYSQLGITPEILNGTASEEVMLNYLSRTVEPVLSAFTDEMRRKFLTKTARTRGHSIMFSKEPFKLVPASKLADIAEKFVGNGVLTPNEVRSIIGFKPSADPSAEELGNRRINQEMGAPTDMETPMDDPELNQNGSTDPEAQYSDASADSDNIANMPISQLNALMNDVRRS